MANKFLYALVFSLGFVCGGIVTRLFDNWGRFESQVIKNKLFTVYRLPGLPTGIKFHPHGSHPGGKRIYPPLHPGGRNPNEQDLEALRLIQEEGRTKRQAFDELIKPGLPKDIQENLTILKSERDNFYRRIHRLTAKTRK